MSDWYKEDIDHVLRHGKSDRLRGLTEPEARLRLRQHGPNALMEKRAKGPWRMLLAQFSSNVVLVLIVSTGISAALGDFKNAITIGVIVVLNALLGFTQEHRAERALAALKKMAVPMVKARRDGLVQEISTESAVPGDIILLEAGNAVPADGRIIESVNLRIQEAALTGESAAVEKTTVALGRRDLPLAERTNMVYAGTVVVHGRGLMVVTETGMTTELGRIAAMIQSVATEPTPLQKRLNQLGSRLALVALSIVTVIFILGLLRGEDLRRMFMTAVSIAVAAVPEGLPAIVTMNLAFGAQRLLRKKALIRRLTAVESLGSVTVICTDKTGTLTENKMEVATLDSHGRAARDLLLIAGSLCNDAVLKGEPSDPQHIHALGDPTETALAMAAVRHGFHKAELEGACPRIREFPFDAARKRMTTVHRVTSDVTIAERLGRPLAPGSSVAFIKGAVDALLTVSSRIFADGTVRILTEADREKIHLAQNAEAAKGMRVLGLAYRTFGGEERPETWGLEQTEKDLIFLGLAGLRDPLRKEAKEAVQTCLAAGIKPVMITGDHALTAQSIAKELGFSETHFITGPQLDRLSLGELEQEVDKTSIFARVTPEHKLNIVQALQKRGHVVAMTGDGVNDAPALKKADIGVAMGISGTDVAKEAAGLVLLDDNFATIVSAVKEGRVIYENIRKFLRYLMTGNVGEISLMFFGPLIGLPMPLLPVQILWMNLITDGIPALALGLEPAERNTMRRPPVSPQENIFGRGMGKQIAWLGSAVGLVPLLVGAWYWHAGNPAWQTMVFTTLIIMHVLLALAFRSQEESFFHLPLLSNAPLLAGVGLSIGLQLAVVYVPALQTFFNTTPLSTKDLAICLTLSTTVFWLAEGEKAWRRRH